MRTQDLNKLKYLLTQVGNDPYALEDRKWAELVELVQALLQQPVAPHEQPFAQALQLDAVAFVDRRLPTNYIHVVRRLGEALAAAPKASALTEPEPDDVEQVARLLRGRQIVVIGGDSQEGHREKFQTHFRAGAVHWPDTREATPDVAALEPWVARRETALVLLLIRWIRHALNDVSDLCAKHDKPLARITAGYNHNKVAHEVMQQCAKRL
jgi:hypothetical protein